MTFHPAAPRTTASLPFEPKLDLLNAASERATAGRTWLAPVPHEQVEHLAQNFTRGHWVIAPILDHTRIHVRPVEASFWVTSGQLERLHDSDAVLATRLTDSLTPVHSVGTVTVGETHHGNTHEYPGEQVLRFVVDRGDGPSEDFDTYDEAFAAALVLADLTAGINCRVRAELRAGNSPHLATVRATEMRVTAQLAVVDYDDDTPIIGYEVLEGTVSVR